MNEADGLNGKGNILYGWEERGGRNVETGGSRRPEDGEQRHGIDEPEKQAEVSG